MPKMIASRTGITRPNGAWQNLMSHASAEVMGGDSSGAAWRGIGAIRLPTSATNDAVWTVNTWNVGGGKTPTADADDDEQACTGLLVSACRRR